MQIHGAKDCLTAKLYQSFVFLRHFTRTDGSAADPDGLRPDVLKDLLCPTTGDSGDQIINLLTQTANLMLADLVPEVFLPFLYSVRLCALSKPVGSIRPIAVGMKLRRLTSKTACTAASSICRQLLSPIQLGIVTLMGAEAASYAMRRFLKEYDRAEVVQ